MECGWASCPTDGDHSGGGGARSHPKVEPQGGRASVQAAKESVAIIIIVIILLLLLSSCFAPFWWCWCMTLWPYSYGTLLCPSVSVCVYDDVPPRVRVRAWVLYDAART